MELRGVGGICRLGAMRLALRIAAAAIGFVGTVVWLFGGPNLGWTKTSVAHEVADPVTGLSQMVWEKTFLPGVDFLAAVLALSLVLGGVSFLARRPSPPQPTTRG